MVTKDQEQQIMPRGKIKISFFDPKTFSYHNSLRYRFDHRHPLLGEFLHYIQVFHNSVSRKVRNIRDDIVMPKARREVDIWVDEQISATVRNFDMRFYGQPGEPVSHNFLVEFTLKIADLIGRHDESGIVDS